MVEAKDLDEAIELAAGIPAVRTGSIEVRPDHAHAAPGVTGSIRR